MFCSNCGNKIADNISTCPSCGAQTQRTQYQQLPLVGFSQRVNDPSFAKYKKASRSWSYIFSIIIAIIAIIAFPIYGKSSGDIDWPYSLYYGFGIGGMFVVIAMLQDVKHRFDKTWDGVVIDKKTYRKANRNSNNGHVFYDTYYMIKIRKDSGKKIKNKWCNTPGLYGYYNIGDRVRHHKGFYYYEKFDKSHDSHIMCIACMTMNEIGNEYCQRCKCPLPK